MKYRLVRLGVPDPLYLHFTNIGTMFWGEERGAVAVNSELTALLLRDTLPDRDLVEVVPCSPSS